FCVYFLCRSPSVPPLFPYTTLFRSDGAGHLTGLFPHRLGGVLRAAFGLVLLPALVALPPYQSARRAGKRSEGEGADHPRPTAPPDRKSTRLNSSHVKISYAVFCLKK